MVNKFQTLSCRTKLSWRGMMPLDTFFLQFRLKGNTNGLKSDNVMERNVSVHLWYKKCHFCFKQNHGYYLGKKPSCKSLCFRPYVIFICYINMLLYHLKCDELAELRENL